MAQRDILEELAKKEIKADDLATEVVSNLDMLPSIIKGISSEKPEVRFGCAKILRTVSRERPDALYPDMHFFIDLLDSDNNIIRWNAMDVVANLTRVDSEKKFEDVFHRYYALLEDESMVTAAHVVDNSGKIAMAKPHLALKITRELLKVEEISRNSECVNILSGKAILAFEEYFELIENKKEVMAFAKRQLKSTRPATRKKAEKFVKKAEE
ncbi:MAG: hypothetical protein JSW28_05750 [Thermoplasmata archaeon]|nr:MAG: hypothetical protein JSW28_05750 [Thermoplasmata archaeon]